MHAHPIYLNVFLYIVVHYRLVVYLLNNLISLYTARMSYYKEVKSYINLSILNYKGLEFGTTIVY